MADDVAFFYVLYSATGLLVVPITLYWIIGWIWRSARPSAAAPAPAAGASATAIHHIVRASSAQLRDCDEWSD